MASPPYQLSSPGSSSLALPRQRPQLALPTGAKSQPGSRKTSLAPAPSSAHPLRQTSYPPSDIPTLEQQHVLAEDKALQYSSAEGSPDEFSDDNDIRSAISGPAGGGDASIGEGGGKLKRKRGEKRPRGRPAKHGGARMGSASLANGDDGKRGTRSVVSQGHDADAEPDDEDEEEEGGETDAKGGRVPLYEGGQMTKAELEEERERRNMLYTAFGPGDHRERSAAQQRVKLKTGDVRKLVNQVLGQSVPANVVLVVSSYAKMFVGQLIEEARDVQGEWTAVEEKRADGSENPVWRKLKRSREAKANAEREPENFVPDVVDTTEGQKNGVIKNEPESPDHSGAVDKSLVNGGHSSPSSKHKSQPSSSKKSDDLLLLPGGAGGLGKDIEEYDRGPLMPDHLREALRRYKKRRGGGSVGFTGISLEGTSNTAARMGGRRLFR